MNPSQFPKSLVGKHSRNTVVFCGSNQCPWIWNQIRWNVHVLYAIILNCRQTEESIEVWLELAEKFLSIHFNTINVLYQTSSTGWWCWIQGKTQQGKGGWKGCTTRVPQFIMARTVWHKQGGLDRTVLKKPREGINDSEDLWPPSPPREREIVMQRLSPDCLFFYLFLSFVISFHSNNRTSYKATAVRPTRP